jgi:hypothetical protein
MDISRLYAASPARPAGTADSTNTRSPQTMGEADPRPGISTFQRTFFVSLHSVGGSPYFETPVAYGPRHCGQKRSAAGSAASIETRRPTPTAAVHPANVMPRAVTRTPRASL